MGMKKAAKKIKNAGNKNYKAGTYYMYKHSDTSVKTISKSFYVKVIKTYTELHHCLHNYDVFYKSERYKLKILQWDADENNRISNKMNSYSKKCGCHSGNFFMTKTFILYAIYYFCNGGTFSAMGADEFIWLIIYTI